MLNAYAVSLEQDPSLPGYAEALETLRKHNPQCAAAIVAGRTPGNFFAGLTDEASYRYVPFNGGLGAEQLAWLRAELRRAVGRGDRLVLFSHVPIHAEASSSRTLVYDADEVLQLLHDEGAGHVVAVIAGHLHRGGYARDDAGIHHITLPSPLNFDECYGHVDIYEDRLELAGYEHAPSMSTFSRALPFPPLPPTLLKCVLEAVP